MGYLSLYGNILGSYLEHLGLEDIRSAVGTDSTCSFALLKPCAESVIRFDFDMKQGWAFGKPDKDTVAEYIESQKEKEYEFAAKRLKLEED